MPIWRRGRLKPRLANCSTSWRLGVRGENGTGASGVAADPMKLRLQADADFNQRIVAGVRRLEPAIDLNSTSEGMFFGKPDLEVLAYCAEEQRTLLTTN